MRDMRNNYRTLLMLMVLPFVVTAVFFAYLPERIPVSFTETGEIARYGNRYEMLLYPLGAMTVGAVTYVLGRFQGKRRHGVFERTLVIFGMVILAGINVVSEWFLWGAAAACETHADIAKLIAIGAGVVVMIIGVILPYVSRNTAFGLRTMWSLENDQVWAKTQRATGILGVVCGFGMVLTGIFFRQLLIAAFVLLLALIWGVSSVFASYRIYKADQKNKPGPAKA